MPSGPPAPHPSPRLPRLSFRQVEAFRAVMVAGTVRGAAAVLRTGQPALTRTLRRMEDLVGVPLFRRAKGRLVPTEEGRILFEHVERLHGQLAGLDRVLERIAGGEGQVFRLGSSPSIARRLLPEALAALRARHPGLRLHLDVLSIAQMPDYLLFGQGECVLTIFPMAHPLVATTRLGEGRLVCLLPAGHPLAVREEVVAGDLAGEPFIAFDDDTPHGRLVACLFGPDVPRPPTSIGVRFAETALNLVATGLGVAVVDEFSAMGAAGLPVEVRPVRGSPRFSVHLNRAAAAGASRFVGELAAELRGRLAARTTP